LTGAKIVRNKKGMSKGFGYLYFKAQEDADKAIAGRHKLRGKMVSRRLIGSSEFGS
jgi:RNA recognition motif-containing protein